MKKKILIISGGISKERSISLKIGFQVAKELKTDPATKHIPVIMLWNSFMGFDDEKFQASGADDRLEKPFDAEFLRNTVLKYVPSMQSNPIAAHIDLPEISRK